MTRHIARVHLRIFSCVVGAFTNMQSRLDPKQQFCGSHKWLLRAGIKRMTRGGAASCLATEPIVQ
ncbi:hypothetical protein SFRURICE_001055 [Spodoptera frugiperda]|nr:hypothetical protein SFRURICE_001055 [Spodoptera frugiperda]